MIMLGCWFAGDVPMPDGSPRSLADSVPFREVYIHALVRDANREKMSKTKGNVIDPIEIVKQYGTDAVRFTLASMASPGTDIAFNVARTEGYRAFANKIWNAARFLFMNVDRAAEIGIAVDPAALGAMPAVAADAPLEDRWIVAELHSTAAKVNQSLENYRYDDAANTIYQFFWGSFCDWYLEIVKLRLDFSETADKAATKAALTTLVSVFEAALRLLSPFMPFLTEEIWHAVYDGNPPAKSIALTRYPQAANTPADEAALAEMERAAKPHRRSPRPAQGDRRRRKGSHAHRGSHWRLAMQDCREGKQCAWSSAWRASAKCASSIRSLQACRSTHTAAFRRRCRLRAHHRRPRRARTLDKRHRQVRKRLGRRRAPVGQRELSGQGAGARCRRPEEAGIRNAAAAGKGARRARRTAGE